MQSCVWERNPLCFATGGGGAAELLDAEVQGNCVQSAVKAAQSPHAGQRGGGKVLELFTGLCCVVSWVRAGTSTRSNINALAQQSRLISPKLSS